MRLLLKKGVLNFPRLGPHEGYAFVRASTVGGRSSIYKLDSVKRED
jgi:hypothetical protein